MLIASEAPLRPLPLGCPGMGGKHGKYAYVERRDGWYVKVRVFKNRDEEPDKYLIVGPKRRDAPPTFPLLKEEDLPEEVRAKLYEV